MQSKQIASLTSGTRKVRLFEANGVDPLGRPIRASFSVAITVDGRVRSCSFDKLSNAQACYGALADQIDTLAIDDIEAARA